jgi:replicative DNA helicase
MKRESIVAASEIQKMAFDPQTDPFDLIDFHTAFNLKMLTQIDNGKTRIFRSILLERIEHIANMMNETSSLTGVDTGFRSINNFTGGWQAPDLVVMAARPGMGKTALALKFILACAKSNKGCAIFSLEMSENQLVDRMISIETHSASAKDLGRGKIQDYQLESIVQKCNEMSKYHIHIDDTAGLSINQFKGKAYKLKQQYDIQLIVVDYLQLMSGEGKGTREQEISQVSRGLKKVAKELGIPIIALSQLSRAVETRGGDKRPQLSDLRESGAIEQDADIVIFLHRPEYYGVTKIDGQDMTGKAEVIFSKHRNGGLDNLMVNFNGKYTDFTDLDTTSIPVPVEPVSESSYGNNFKRIEHSF